MASETLSSSIEFDEFIERGPLWDGGKTIEKKSIKNRQQTLNSNYRWIANSDFVE